MISIVTKLLSTLIITIGCVYAGALCAQETAKTEADSPADIGTTGVTAIEPTQIPGHQHRLQYPANDGSDVSQMEALAEQILSGTAPQLTVDALVWLKTLSNDRFLGLWQPDRTGNPRGALLIVHAEGGHLAWPDTIRPLHATLPDYGWATLAVSLPDPVTAQIPKRTLPAKTQLQTASDELMNTIDDIKIEQETETVPTNSTATDKNINTSQSKKVAADSLRAVKTSSKNPEEVTQQRLAAALLFLHDKGQFNVVILGDGAGAIRANNFLNNTTPKIDDPSLGAAKPFSGIVLLNGRNRLPTMQQDYTEWFTDPKTPVLDIFLNKDLRNLQAAKARAVIAKQKGVVIYKQVKLNSLATTSVGQENLLSRRIRSYLSVNVKGIEVGALKAIVD